LSRELDLSSGITRGTLFLGGFGTNKKSPRRKLPKAAKDKYAYWGKLYSESTQFRNGKKTGKCAKKKKEGSSEGKT